MDILRLRTLTLKSKCDFNTNNPSKTVLELIEEKSSFRIVSAYYTKEKINFSEEVLQLLEIIYPKFYRIEKPGKDLDFKNKLFNANLEEKSMEDLLKIIRAMKINGKNQSEVVLNLYKFLKFKQRKTKDNSSLRISKTSLRDFNQKK